MKNVKKCKTKNVNKIIEILKVKDLLKIRGGEQPDSGDPTQRDIDFD